MSETSRSFIDILRLNLDNDTDRGIINAEYNGNPLKELTIDENLFTNYGDIQFSWEKSYFEEPGRSSGGVIDNLNDYPTFVVPHLKFHFDIMSLDDYRRLVQLDLLINEHTISFFDPVFNRMTQKKMYFAPSELKKLNLIHRVRFNNNQWEDFLQIAGTEDVSVELIGTNSEIENVNVIYYSNFPSNSEAEIQKTITVKDGESIYAGYGTAGMPYTFTEGGKTYDLTHWSTHRIKEKGIFIPSGFPIFVLPGGLTLYAQWTERIT